jgi:hypothetical protein
MTDSVQRIKPRIGITNLFGNTHRLPLQSNRSSNASQVPGVTVEFSLAIAISSLLLHRDLLFLIRICARVRRDNVTTGSRGDYDILVVSTTGGFFG